MKYKERETLKLVGISEWLINLSELIKDG